jgi:chemotaxis regulatin CheY-phosphate phosphatase CheZ
LHLNASSRSRELEELRKRDHDELVEMLTRALHDKSLLKILLATSTPEDAHDIVDAIEQARYTNTVTSYFSVSRHVYTGVEGGRRGRDAGETAPRRPKGVV